MRGSGVRSGILSSDSNSFQTVNQRAGIGLLSNPLNGGRCLARARRARDNDEPLNIETPNFPLSAVNNWDVCEFESLGDASATRLPYFGSNFLERSQNPSP